MEEGKIKKEVDRCVSTAECKTYRKRRKGIEIKSKRKRREKYKAGRKGYIVRRV